MATSALFVGVTVVVVVISKRLDQREAHEKGSSVLNRPEEHNTPTWAIQVSSTNVLIQLR